MKKTSSLLFILLSTLLLVACNKKAPESASVEAISSASASTTAATTAQAPTSTETTSTPLELTKEEKELAEKRSLMEYSKMEESYLTDVRGQWATNAIASSSFGNANKDDASRLESSIKAAGAPDTKSWTNNNQELGFDWLDLNYAKPVNATEVRVALENGNGSESLSKIELKDEAGNWHVMWSDISTIKEDKRGRRTWFVKSFEKTKFKVVGVKISFANNLERRYKYVDAVQLIGD